MKPFIIGLLVIFIVSNRVAADEQASPLTPLPRVKLDPAVLPTVPPPRADAPAANNDPIALERMVVRQRALDLGPRREVEDPTGKFSPLNGGRFYRRDAGPFRFEAGIWPTIDLFPEESRFKSTKLLVSFDLLRIRW